MTVPPRGAAVQGTTATFGTWSVDDGSKTLIVHIEGGMFPGGNGFETFRHAVGG